jgi:hypothetical protein
MSMTMDRELIYELKRHTCSEEPHTSQAEPHLRMKTVRLVEKPSLHEHATQHTMNALSATNNALSNESPSASASTPSLPQRSASESPGARRRRHALKLRVVHHKDAAPDRRPRARCRTPRAQARLAPRQDQGRGRRDRRADYDEHHTVCFEETASVLASLDEQLRDTESLTQAARSLAPA